MNKAVVIVDDKLRDVEDIMLNIQTILLLAKRRKMKNAPENEDTKIVMLRLRNEKQGEQKEWVKRIEESVKKRGDMLVDFYKLPVMEYEFCDLPIPEDVYSLDISETVEKIKANIDKYCEKCEYVILLDLVLVPDVDVMRVQQGERTISQYLYEEKKEHCIPFTNYEDELQTFREKWKKILNVGEKIFEKDFLIGNTVYKPYKEQLYTKLKIGDDYE